MTSSAPCGARVAAVLRRRREEIIDRWVAVERHRNDELACVDRNELVDSMPRMLDELASHLEGHHEDARFDAPTIETANEHGAQRVSLGIPLEVLVEEYAILRRVVVRLAKDEPEPLTFAELEQFHALLDIAMRFSAAAYMTAQTQARDRILGIVSHDLRNPLNAIMLGAQALALRHAEDDKSRHVLARMVASANRALRMIADLLDYSNSAAGGGIRVHRRRTDLVTVIEDVLDELRAAFPRRAIVFATELRPLEGTWDPDRLAQVVGNLVRNALQYSPAASAVEVRARVAADDAWLEVHNEGPPIDAELLPRLFEPFRSGSTGASVAGNVGLGLFIAHEVVRAHRGAIDVASSAEDGTTFSVRLPRAVA